MLQTIHFSSVHLLIYDTTLLVLGMSWSWVLEVHDSEDRLVRSGGIQKACDTTFLLEQVNALGQQTLYR